LLNKRVGRLSLSVCDDIVYKKKGPTAHVRSLNPKILFAKYHNHPTNNQRGGSLRSVNSSKMSSDKKYHQRAQQEREAKTAAGNTARQDRPQAKRSVSRCRGCGNKTPAKHPDTDQFNLQSRSGGEGSKINSYSPRMKEWLVQGPREEPFTAETAHAKD